MKHDKATMNFQRKMLAVMGFLLPLLATIPGFIGYDRNAKDFWHSISATYYATSRDFMVGTLFTFGCFLLVYLGYDLGDRLTCRFSGMMSFSILLFPCKTSTTGPTTGILNLPTDLSHVIHCICAGLLFASFAYMIGCRFTKSDGLQTTGKIKRNRVYVICAVIIVLGMVNQVITSMMGISWFTIINETIMLWAFSFAWAVKSNLIKRLRDVQQICF